MRGRPLSETQIQRRGSGTEPKNKSRSPSQSQAVGGGWVVGGGGGGRLAAGVCEKQQWTGIRTHRADGGSVRLAGMGAEGDPWVSCDWQNRSKRATHQPSLSPEPRGRDVNGETA